MAAALGHDPVPDRYSVDDGALAEVRDAALLDDNLSQQLIVPLPCGVVGCPFPAGYRFQSLNPISGEDAAAVFLAAAHGPRPQREVVLGCLDVEPLMRASRCVAVRCGRPMLSSVQTVGLGVVPRRLGS